MNHETGEALEGSRDTDRRRHFNQNPFCCVNVDLEFPGLVDRRVQQSQEALSQSSQHVGCRRRHAMPATTRLSAPPQRVGSSDLVCDIWPGVTDVPVHLPHDANMFIAVEERIFFFALDAIAASTSMGCLVSLETCVRKHNDQSLAVLVGGSDRYVLFRNELRKRGGRERLRACGIMRHVSEWTPSAKKKKNSKTCVRAYILPRARKSGKDEAQQSQRRGYHQSWSGPMREI